MYYIVAKHEIPGDETSVTSVLITDDRMEAEESIGEVFSTPRIEFSMSTTVPRIRFQAEGG